MQRLPIKTCFSQLFLDFQSYFQLFKSDSETNPWRIRYSTFTHFLLLFAKPKNGSIMCPRLLFSLFFKQSGTYLLFYSFIIKKKKEDKTNRARGNILKTDHMPLTFLHLRQQLICSYYYSKYFFYFYWLCIKLLIIIN